LNNLNLLRVDLKCSCHTQKKKAIIWGDEYVK
jgi:hypothetical protein